MSRKSKGDIKWTIPNHKTAIAYSTQATSDLIVINSWRKPIGLPMG